MMHHHHTGLNVYGIASEREPGGQDRLEAAYAYC